MIFQAKGHENQADASILISDKLAFNLKLFRRDKEDTYSAKKTLQMDIAIFTVSNTERGHKLRK